MKDPCPGLSMRRTPEGHAFIRLHWTADEVLASDPAKVDKLRSKFKSQAYWDLEMEMKADALSGQKVFPEWSPELHVIPDDKVPLEGCIYMGIDPHPRTPHAMLWVLIDAFNDWYVYRELWPSIVCGSNRNIKDDESDNLVEVRDYVDMIALYEGNRIKWKNVGEADEYGIYEQRPRGELVVTRYMDQAGKAFRASGEESVAESYARRYNRYGIECADPRKAVEVGYDNIRAKLKPRKVDEVFAESKGLESPYWSQLHIAESCVETQLEFDNLRYIQTKTPSVEKELKQQAITLRRHLIDVLRYLVTSDAGYSHRNVSRRYDFWREHGEG